MTDEPLYEEVDIVLRAPTNYEAENAMLRFIEQYDEWKDVFALRPVVESFHYNEFQFVVKVTTPIYDEEGEEVEGESDYDFLGFIVLGPSKCIEFLWIREDERRQGYGTEAVQLSGAEHYNFALNDSQVFWDSLSIGPTLKEGGN